MLESVGLIGLTGVLFVCALAGQADVVIDIAAVGNPGIAGELCDWRTRSGGGGRDDLGDFG